jgi:hypothetical protein
LKLLPLRFFLSEHQLAMVLQQAEERRRSGEAASSSQAGPGGRPAARRTGLGAVVGSAPTISCLSQSASLSGRQGAEETHTLVTTLRMRTSVFNGMNASLLSCHIIVIAAHQAIFMMMCNVSRVDLAMQGTSGGAQWQAG